MVKIDIVDTTSRNRWNLCAFVMIVYNYIVNTHSLSNQRGNSIVIGIIVIILLVGIGGAYIWKGKQVQKSVRPVVLQKEEKKEELKLFENEWGMRIRYPIDLTVEPATKSGELAGYVFTNPAHKGSLSISTKESSAEDLLAFFTSDKSFATASGNLDTTIGGEPGKKMRFADSSIQRAVVQQAGQVFMFEVDPAKGEENYWDDIYTTILTKFEFLPFEEEKATSSVPSENSSDSSGGDVEEEIIE